MRIKIPFLTLSIMKTVFCFNKIQSMKQSKIISDLFESRVNHQFVEIVFRFISWNFNCNETCLLNVQYMELFSKATIL